MLPFQQCQERQGLTRPEGPRVVPSAPSLPSRQLHGFAPSGGIRACSAPSRGGLSQRRCHGDAQQWDTAGLAAGLCTPWPAPLTSGIPPCVRDVGPVLLLTPGQPQQGLCLLNLSISGHLQLYHRADHLNPSSCTCWGWSCQE